MVDFISSYGEYFGVAESNLLGNNRFKFGEFSARRVLVRKALKLLISEGMIDIYNRNSRFRFSINDEGMDYIGLRLSRNPFATEYKDAAINVFSGIQGRTEDELSKYIHSASLHATSLFSLGQGGSDG